jgi:hypothetical protein
MLRSAVRGVSRCPSPSLAGPVRSVSLLTSFHHSKVSLEPLLSPPQKSGFRFTTSLRCASGTASADGLKDRIVEVSSPEQARSVIAKMRTYPKHIWACDTEVVDIDLDEQGPVGNGRVICASLYAGPDVDVGYGKGKILWIDNAGPALGTLAAFKEWFEDEAAMKVWHNYGFDRHVMHNEGIDCLGFKGDTMHMARLWDTGRDKAQGGKGYSLESLSSLLTAGGGAAPAAPATPVSAAVDGTAPTTAADGTEELQKISMMDLFGIPKKKKDGEDSKIKVLPNLLELQTSSEPGLRDKWIEYSSRDALATWELFRYLELQLQKMPWLVEDKPIRISAGDVAVEGQSGGNMLQFYDEYLRQFGSLLTDLERRGIFIDTAEHLPQAEARARQERQNMESMFLAWAAKHCPQAKYLNTASTAQMMQLFFGTYQDKKLAEPTKSFKIEKEEQEYLAEQAEAVARNKYINSTVGEMKAELKLRGLPVSGKKADIIHRLLMSDVLAQRMAGKAGVDDLLNTDPLQALDDPSNPLVVEANQTASDILTTSLSKPSRHREVNITTIGLSPMDFTPAGVPQVTAAVLRKLAGKNIFGDGTCSV